MKKIYGFLTAAAILLTAACTQDLEEQKKVDEVKGDFFMTMNITQATSIGTRTATGDQGIEVGKARENKINSALIIFATPDANTPGSDYTIFQTVKVGSNDLVAGDNNSNLAVFEMNRETIQNDIKGGTSGNGTQKDYYIFVVANPNTEMTGSLVANAKVQKSFSLNTDGDVYWSLSDDGPNFLMSSRDYLKKTITSTDVATGTHTTASNPLHLGTVEIQRAMSRFDIETAAANTNFSITNGNTDYSVEIELTDIALVNQATEAKLFKVTDVNGIDYFDTKQIHFAKEGEEGNDYVITPKQTAFTLPFFGNGSATDGKLTGNQVDYSELVYKSLGSLDQNDETFTHPGSSSAVQGTYKIWRYCMENTNAPMTQEEVTAAKPNDNQFNGNSTGVAFKAKMSSDKFDAVGGADVYAYNSVILGTIGNLRDYVKNPKVPDMIENTGEDKESNPTVPNPNRDPGVYEMVKIQWAAAINAYNKANGGKYVETPAEGSVPEGKVDWMTTDQLETLATDLHDYLKAQKFTIYKSTDLGEGQSPRYAYYCYYIYWNRHNDNGKETEMGPMEFATVRNNVYKLRVTNIYKLGHPGDPNDDPEPNKPDDPDEKDHLYMSVECKVLPWEVRVNDIIF